MTLLRTAAAALVATALGQGTAQALPMLPDAFIDGATLFALDTTVDVGGDFLFAAGLIDVFDDGAGGAPDLPYDFTITGFLADVALGGLELNVFANLGDVDAILFGRSFTIASSAGIIEIGFDVETDATGLFGDTVLALLLEGTDVFADDALASDFSAAGATAQLTAAERAAVIPLPLTAPLLAGALGMLVVAFRRRM